MSNLSLVKSENFGTVQCDFYRDDKKELWMTREQIGAALGYVDPRDAIAKIHSRNSRRLSLFSRVDNLSTVEGNREVSREVFVYNAKGVYEICRWSRQPKADAFYDWVYEVLESLRKGEAVLVDVAKLRAIEAEARLRNARARQGKQMITLAEKFKGVLSPMAVETLVGEAAAVTCGYPVLPKPAHEKTYTATEIGEMVGLSANMIGRFAIANKLKTDDYGHWVLDKSPYSGKQVSSFVYNERGKNELVEVCRAVKTEGGSGDGKHS